MNIRTLLGHLAFAFTLSLVYSTNVAVADDPAPATPTETDRLKNDVERLKAEQDRFEAKFGTLADGVAPKGDVKAEGLVVEGEILAYRTVDMVATKIATAVKGASPGRVAIFSEADLKLMTEWHAATSQVRLLDRNRREISSALPGGSCPPSPAVDAAAVPVAGIVNVAVAAFSLFRVDRTITGSKVELNDFAVTAQIANKLGDDITVVYLPSVYDLSTDLDSADVGILKELKELEERIDSDHVDTENNRDKLKKCKPIADEVQAKREALLKQVGDIIDELTKTDDAGLSRIQAYMRASHMSKLAQGAWLLQIKPIAASGNVLTTKNLFYTKLRFGGGSVISYMLFKPSGELARSGTVGGYEGNRKMSEIPSLIGTN